MSEVLIRETGSPQPESTDLLLNTNGWSPYRSQTAGERLKLPTLQPGTVARLMPIGGYAEPATPRGDASDGFDRCFRFARDGWSVARLVHPSRRRVDLLRQLAERLLRATAPATLSASVFANTGSGYENIEAELDRLGGIVDAWRFSRSSALTIVFGAIDTESAPCFSVASANGLAG